ncbi:MAG: GxxExxY protein [Spirochaetales bacterium]|nr:GxxExxY protein [Spirochaetales bacterium]
MHENELSEKIIGCSIVVHKLLGPGLLESVYETALVYELTQNGLRSDRQKEMPVSYRDTILPAGFRADVVVEDKVLIELKSVERLLPLHWKQVLTYLKLSDLKLGLLINFNTAIIKEGIKRIVNNL